jgi:hypothetical protein
VPEAREQFGKAEERRRPPLEAVTDGGIVDRGDKVRDIVNCILGRSMNCYSYL